MIAQARLGQLAIAMGVLAIACGFFFGETYIKRLPFHAGYYLVPVDDVVRAPAPPRPRHTVVAVIDGLRMKSALGLDVVTKLRKHGQCRVMDNGALTVSRPVYTVLSTGLEVDRTGSRNNDETSRLAADSIWDDAKRNGLEVVGASHLLFWSQLFPDGFTRYHRTVPVDDDIFVNEPLGDLTLFHPDYVDAAGHAFGGASPEYAAAVVRADRELTELLGRLDLERDVMVLTADHGHVDRGGHGGPQPELRDVLTCYSGTGILRTEEQARLDARSFAPSLALLLGLPCPRHMRAGEDDLDAIFTIVDLAKFPAYAADRHAAIAHYRDVNEHALVAWLGGPPGTWSRLYEREGDRHLARLGEALAFLVLLFVIASRRAGIAWSAIGSTTLWVIGLYTVAALLHVVMRGSLDFTAVNSKASYVPSCLAIGFLSGGLGCAVHRALFHDSRRLMRDQLTALGLLLAFNGLHPLAFGWPLGFPLPGPQLLVFPFFGAILLVAGGLLTIALGLATMRRGASK